MRACEVPLTRRVQEIDRLAAVAVVLAIGPLPLLGIGHPATHVLTFAIAATFGWLLTRPAVSVAEVVGALDIGRPSAAATAACVAVAGVLSGIVRWWLDRTVLGGQGGIAFYEELLRSYGVIAADGVVDLAPLAIYVPLLLPVIVFDGIFFVGLIQQRIAAHTNRHVGVQIQALLFALPHALAGPTPDIAYGVGTYLGGVAYGYVYLLTGNHWIAASLLWLHVSVVWLLLTALR